MSLRLVLFGMVTAALVGAVYVMMAPLIETSKEAARQQALFSLAAPLLEDGDIAPTVNRTLPDDRPDSLAETLAITPILRNNETRGVVIPLMTREGYSGDIHFLLALDVNQTIVGFRVIEHRETPGLGDGIEHTKSDWIQQFSGLRYTDLSPEDWAVTRDGGVFDVFTGATITPRATVEALADTLAYFNTHPEVLEIRR